MSPVKGEDGVPIPHPDTYPGLEMAFELAAQGKTDREIALALNSAGYRTAGNQGNRPFTKGTVGGILTNRFYIGYISNGNGGYIKAKHNPFVTGELFDIIQQSSVIKNRIRQTINIRAQVYSLSTLMKCTRCGSSIRIQKNPKGKPRVYCSGRAEGLDCSNRGTFLDIYESQIEWYLERFIIPEDYQTKILESHRKLESVMLM